MNSEDWDGINIKGGNPIINNPTFNQGSPRQNLNRKEYQNRRALLAQVKNEVEGRLSQSLHNIDPIKLQKEEQPYQVKRPWDAEVKIGTQPSTPLPSETDIKDLFNQPEIAGRLLILGAPGSGKTTTLLELARELIACAESRTSQPMPVLFNLSEWKEDPEEKLLRSFRFLSFFWKKDPRRGSTPQDPTIAEWLITQLQEKYGVSPKIGQKWLDERQLLPLLDGLDELESGRQELCVQAINRFLGSEERPSYLVACCRREEYENYNTRLHLNGAICLQPLADSQIEYYLMQFGYRQLWESIENDGDLFDLAKSPLLLSMMTLAYQEISIEEWQNRQTAESRRQYLFDAYIKRMLNRDIGNRWYGKKQLEPEKTKHWLSQLAKNLKQESQTDFLIENMQPDWLKSSNQKWIYRLSIYLTLGKIIDIISTFFYFSILQLLGDEYVKFLFLAILILTPLLLVFIFSEIKTTEIVKFSWQESLKSLPNALFICIAFVLLVVWRNHITIKVSTLILGLKILLNTLLISILWQGLNTKNVGVEQRTIPNQGIWQSLNNAGILALIMCLIVSSGNWLVHGHNANIISLILVGLLMGSILGLRFGGAACIKHLILRLILWQNGSIPWNYSRFLDYATERLFLQRIGGRYRFMHDLLREHFAGGSSGNKCLHTLNGHLKTVSTLAISPDGSTLASGSFDNTIKLWNLTSGKLLHTLSGHFKLWNLTSGKLLHTLSGHSNGVNSVAISPNSQILANTNNDATINISKLDTGELLHTFSVNPKIIWRASISPDNQTLAGGCDDGTITLWNLENKKLLRTFSRHSAPVTAIAFSPDGQTLASGSTTIKLWNLHTGKLLRTLHGHPIRRLLQKLRPLLNRLGFTRSGTIYSVTFSPDGQTLASGSAGNAIELWNLHTGKLMRTLSGSSDWILSVAISLDGQLLAGGTDQGAIELWNLQTGELLSTLDEHCDTVNSLAFSPDGQTLVSGSDDKTIKIWHISPLVSQPSPAYKLSKIPWAKLAPLIMSFVTLFYIFILFGVGYFAVNSNPTSSMAPTLQHHEHLIIDKITYRFRNPQRGDIVLINPRDSLKQHGFSNASSDVRRIIGLPGETVALMERGVYINGQLLQQTYVTPETYSVSFPSIYEHRPKKLPADSYLVLGNNPNYSGKEPFGAVVSKDEINGRVVFCVFPLNKFGKIH